MITLEQVRAQAATYDPRSTNPREHHDVCVYWLETDDTGVYGRYSGRHRCLIGQLVWDLTGVQAPADDPSVFLVARNLGGKWLDPFDDRAIAWMSDAQGISDDGETWGSAIHYANEEMS